MKKLRILLTIIFISICLTGCGSLINQASRIEGFFLDEEIAEVESIAHIGFTEGDVSETSENIIMAATDFTNFESEYTKFNTSLHYDSLSDNEKLVYNAFLYALENGYTSILIDNLLIESATDAEKILYYLSLDSPLLEQNLIHEYGTFLTYHNAKIDSIFPHQVKFDGFYITIDNFASQWWDKKLDALDKAREIVANIPAELSQEEKAERLFVYLCENTNYALSERLNGVEVQANLYDALITGKTQCDGFSNALSLLYNMAGITCSEKLFHGIGDELGHTWSFFEINGKWYNADATNSSLIPTDRTYMHSGINFGFSDILQSKKPVYSANYPESNEQLFMPIDGHFSSINDEEVINTAYSAFKNHQGQWCLLLLDSCDADSLDTQMGKLATKLYQTVYYLTFDVTENRTAVLIHEEGLINYIEPNE